MSIVNNFNTQNLQNDTLTEKWVDLEQNNKTIYNMLSIMALLRNKLREKIFVSYWIEVVCVTLQ